jgi:predicted Holliday junction resolvase-like endonuclease
VVSNADDIITIQGVRFIGGPCDYLDFEGFDAINGTYYVDWPEGGGEVELGRWAQLMARLQMRWAQNTAFTLDCI